MDVHLRETFPKLSGHFKGAAFRECEFDDVSGLLLETCDMTKSRFVTDDIKKLLNFTITLNCLSFNEVELSPLIFDLILCLLLKTKGNNAKRRKIIDSVLGRARAYEILKSMEHLECPQ